MRAGVLVGPTAVGKSAVAQWIAERLGVPVLSADSMLVYRGMDVGTAKPTPEELAGVDLRGTDLADPDEPFSAGAWLRAARAAFDEAARAGREVIVAGGTGLYVSALLRGIDAPASDPALRAELEAELAAGGPAALVARAEALRPGSTAAIDARNPRRLVRLVEILTRRKAENPHAEFAEESPHAEFAEGAEKHPHAEFAEGAEKSPHAEFAENAEKHPHAEFAEDAEEEGGASSSREPPLVGLEFPSEALEVRILRRARAMFDGGLPEEVRRLCERFPGFERSTAGAGIGYAEALAALRGEISVEEAVARTALRTRRLAKRQRTWWRHQARVEWVPGPVDETDVARAADDVQQLWRKHGPSPVFL